MKNKIENINNEFFGEDARKRYIKDNFIRVLRGAIIRGAIIDILIEASKNRTHIRKSSDGITYGDFDPDNAGYLYDLFSFYEKGFVIDVRQLLTVQEDGAAGKFVKLAKNISINDLYAY